MGEQTLGTIPIRERTCMPCGNGCAECSVPGLCSRCKAGKFLNAMDPGMCVQDCSNLPDDYGTPNHKFFHNTTSDAC